MSDYKKVTRHPNKPKYYIATWHDDYFGPHLYGVEFDFDKVIYPAEQVEQAQLKEFWAADVMEAFKSWLPTENKSNKYASNDEALIDFLAHLDFVYQSRWKRDPMGGEGAVANEVSK